MRNAPVTTLSDRERSLPAGTADRLDAAEAAVASLDRERARVRRLGLEPAIARCESERRYWIFVRALVRLADSATTTTHSLPEASPWPAPAAR